MELVTGKSNIEKTYKAEVEVPWLVEEFVDEDWVLKTVTPKCLEFWEFVKANFTPEEGEILIKYDINGPIVDRLDKIPITIAAIADAGIKRGHGYPGVIRWMRMLWRNGKVRRFYGGLWDNAVKGNVTGLKWGVRYLWRDE